jgi:hypothetical protein
LPFLTAASLMVMALALGVGALVRRRRRGGGPAEGLELPADFRRTMALGGILTVYVLALDLVPVDVAFEVWSLRFVIGAFETVSLIVLTAILRVYWQAPLSTCVAVALGWIAFLSVVFRMIFHVPLP